MTSQYTNQANVNINDMLRLTFRDTSDGSNFEDIVTLAMHIEFAKIMCNTVMDAIVRHEKNVEMQKQNNDSDKDLN